MSKNRYDLIVIGAGACGMMSAIIAARRGKNVLIIEKLSKVGAKLRATGGGRCNLSNTLQNDEFISSFGKNGRFMQSALELFDYKKLQSFFEEIGVKTDALDGKRIFPVTHDSTTILSALEEEMKRLKVRIMTSARVERIIVENKKINGVIIKEKQIFAKNVVVATGGLGYPSLGTQGDGFVFARSLGHTVTELFPAMMPLLVKQSWVKNCRADTIAKVELKVDLKKEKKLTAKGDLIFTKDGIRGPVVLDFSREITPLLSKYKEVPLLLNLTKGENEDSILKLFNAQLKDEPSKSTLELVKTILPEPLSKELCLLAQADYNLGFKKLDGKVRAKLLKILAWTPLTVVGDGGFDKAMITRGGVALKEIDAKSMKSKLIDGLFFCGEVVNLDGPCGGFNLQWSFSSGFLAGMKVQ